MAETQASSVPDLAYFMLESKQRVSNIGPLAILQVPASACKCLRARVGRDALPTC